MQMFQNKEMYLRRENELNFHFRLLERCLKTETDKSRNFVSLVLSSQTWSWCSPGINNVVLSTEVNQDWLEPMERKMDQRPYFPWYNQWMRRVSFQKLPGKHDFSGRLSITI